MDAKGEPPSIPGGARNLSEIGERAAVASVLSRLHAKLPESGPVVIGPGDDAAAIRLPDGEIAVVTTDSLVEGEHFERAWTAPGDLGFKLIQSAASDVVAMGGRPLVAVAAVSAPGEFLESELNALTEGMLEAARSLNLTLAGGDTTASRHLVLTATVLGSARAAALRSRGSARPGDRVAVTGPLGDAVAGLLVLLDLYAGDGLPAGSWLRATSPLAEIGQRLESGGWRARGAEAGALAQAVEHFLRPSVTSALGELASSAGATALIDISDGLASELKLISIASAVGVVVDEALVPVGEGAKVVAAEQGRDPLALALNGGEDYELLLTVPPSCWEALVSALQSAGKSATAIGEVVPSGAGLSLRDAQGARRPLPAGGFEHFRAGKAGMSGANRGGLTGPPTGRP